MNVEKTQRAIVTVITLLGIIGAMAAIILIYSSLDTAEEENECLNLPVCETYKCRANQIDSNSGTWHLQRKQNYLLEYQNCLLENGGLNEN